MRINKKERIDVKRYMEEMKANRTNRSYTSIENRNRQNSEEGNYQEKHLASKHSLFTNENDYSRSRNPAPQGLRYNFDPNIRNMQPIQTIQPVYASYMPPMSLNDFSMTQQSQIYASPPYPQHAGMMNYSQAYPSIPTYHQPQQETRMDHSYSGEMNYGMNYQQGKKQSIKFNANVQPTQEEPVGNFTNFMKNQEVVPKKSDKCEEKKVETIEVVQAVTSKKKSVSLDNDKKSEAKPKKEQKKKKAYKKRSPKMDTEREQDVVEQEIDTTVNISKKFDEILLMEKKRIEERQIQEAKVKNILQSFNEKIGTIAENYFSSNVVKHLSIFERKMKRFCEEKTVMEDGFGQKLLEFESAIMGRVAV